MKRYKYQLFLILVLLINIQFKLHSQLNVVKYDGKLGIENDKGELILEYKYDVLYNYEKFDFFKGKINDRSFLIDQQGNEYPLVNDINDINTNTLAVDIKNCQNLEDLFNANQIQILFVRSNHIDSVFEKINLLQNLIYVDFSNNEIDNFPTELFNLHNLKYIDLTKNQIKKVPTELYSMKNLCGLSLHENLITEISTEIKNLINLQYLFLTDNKLTIIPQELWLLKEIEILTISGGFRQIPEEISNLRKLRKVMLTNNNFPEISFEYFKNLNELKFIQLDKNNIKRINPDIGELKQIKYLNLCMNDLKKLPKEISKLKGLKGLYIFGNKFNFFQRRKIQKLLPNADIRFRLLMK
ncbi:MAG: hypothetical protein ABFS35_16695 [Bacteroidota bacterium]